jgi:hypothetical protein
VRHAITELELAAIYPIPVLLIIRSAWRRRQWLYAVPVLFSLDNFAIAGILSDDLEVALGSAGMAIIGLVLGGSTTRVTNRLAASGAPV